MHNAFKACILHTICALRIFEYAMHILRSCLRLVLFLANQWDPGLLMVWEGSPGTFSGAKMCSDGGLSRTLTWANHNGFLRALILTPNCFSEILRRDFGSFWNSQPLPGQWFKQKTVLWKLLRFLVFLDGLPSPGKQLWKAGHHPVKVITASTCTSLSGFILTWISTVSKIP